MSFVTDDMVEAGAKAAVASQEQYPRPWERLNSLERMLARQLARAVLEAAAPIWLAHVQRASEHTADYRIAEAAAELRRLATTEGGSTT